MNHPYKRKAELTQSMVLWTQRYSRGLTPDYVGHNETVGVGRLKNLKLNSDYSLHSTSRGGILGRNWDGNLKTFAPCYSQSPPKQIFLSVFLDLRFLLQQLTVGGGLDLFPLSFCLHLSGIVLSLITLHFYLKTSFLQKQLLEK